MVVVDKSLVAIKDREFDKLRQYVYDQCGINLTDKKRTLLVTRLQKVLKSRGYNDFGAYYEHLQADNSGRMLDELVNHISTNFTYFWREAEHFKHFHQEALPQVSKTIEANGGKDLRVWCAAAATGEEPYMLAMLIRDFLGPRAETWKAGLLATDISKQALDKARRGIYPLNAVNGMPVMLRHRYFGQAGKGQVAVVDQIRRDVTFRRLNLINTLPFRKPFHVIFCRNVMIYFDNPTRMKLVERMFEMTVPGGYLYVGHSESLGRLGCSYEYIKPAVYRKPMK